MSSQCHPTKEKWGEEMIRTVVLTNCSGNISLMHILLQCVILSALSQDFGRDMQAMKPMMFKCRLPYSISAFGPWCTFSHKIFFSTVKLLHFPFTELKSHLLSSFLKPLTDLIRIVAISRMFLHSLKPPNFDLVPEIANYIHCIWIL